MTARRVVRHARGVSPVACLAALGAMLLGGCGGGFVRETAAPAVYRLDAPRLAEAAPLPVELRVERPVAAAGLGDDRLATVWPGGRIDYLRDARWGDALPVVVAAALVESLSRSGAFRAVHDETSPFVATHVLHLEIRRFEADYRAGAPPVVRVSLAGSVGRADDRHALAPLVAEAESRAQANTQAAVVQAFNEAYGRAVADLAAATLQALR